MAVKKEDSTSRVFVYGSLKEGFGNNVLLQEGYATKLASVTLQLPYRMVDLGWYPAVCPVDTDSDSNLYDISGEVYEVPEETLYALDCLEGYPSYYDRVKINTPEGKAWMYFLPNHYLARCNVVESGVWGEDEDAAA